MAELVLVTGRFGGGAPGTPLFFCRPPLPFSQVS